MPETNSIDRTRFEVRMLDAEELREQAEIGTTMDAPSAAFVPIKVRPQADEG
jgi:hypothetical protein